MSPAIRVLIADDDPLVRTGLAMILDAAPNLTVVGEAADGTEVVPAVDAYAPDVVLMDIRMPKLDGLAATELLRARPDPPEVIVLTTFHADEYVLRALRAGATGFLLKDTRPTEILHAISRVAAGEPILSPEVTRQLIAHVGTTGRGRPAATRQDHAGQAQRPRTGGRRGGGSGQVQRADQPRAVHERGHRQSPRVVDTHQARPQQPHADRAARPRRRVATAVWLPGTPWASPVGSPSRSMRPIRNREAVPVRAHLA
jgi:DNA-binding NarL/FixJ family response regulator